MSGNKFNVPLIFSELDSIVTPGTGTKKLYAKIDGIYTKNSGDHEVKLADKDLTDIIQKYTSYGITSGIITGGQLKINDLDNTRFDIEPFVGLFVDQYTDPDNSVIYRVEFDGIEDIEPLYLTQQQVTYISIDKDLNIYQTPARLTPDLRRDRIELGIVVHNNLSNINGFNNNPTLATDIAGQTYDLFYSIGLFRVDEGNRLIPNNSLTFSKTEGRIFRPSSNYAEDIRNPNIKVIPEESTVDFYYRRIDGTTESITSELIVNEYETYDELTETSTINTITGDTNQATVQRVILFESGKIIIQRGQDFFPTISSAINNFLNTDFRYETNVAEDGLLIGCIATTLKCKDLSDTSNAVFISTDRYGTIIGGSNAGFFDLDGYQVVKSLSDLPEPIDNEIHLNAGWTYQINGQVNLDDNILVLGSSTNVIGNNPNYDILITNSEESLITATDVGGIINYLGLMNNNVNGSIFNVFDNTSLNSFVIRNSFILNHYNIGSIGGLRLFLIEAVYITDFKGGLELIGDTQSDFFINKVFVLPQTTSGNTLFRVETGSFGTLKFWDCDATIHDGNTFLNVDVEEVNLLNGTLRNGIVTGNEFILEGTGQVFGGGLSSSTGGWVMSNNRNVENSTITGFIEFVNNGTATTINNTATYYKAAGTNGGRTFSERMNVSTNNRIEYICPCRPIFRGSILLSGSFTFASGNNNSLVVAIYKNGTENISEIEILVPRSGDPTQFALNTIDDVEVNDYYEVFVRNLASTANITVVDMQFRISGQP